MAEVNFDITCPHCNKLIKRDINSEALKNCPFCKALLYKRDLSIPHSAIDLASNKTFKGAPMYPSDHIRDMIASIPKRPQLPEVKDFSHWLSGNAAFVALKKAVDELVALAPEDNDVIVQAFNISVREISYIEPHTFLLRGFNYDGHHTSVVAHFSQLVAHIVYLPKKGNDRIITGFSRQKEEE